MARYVLITGSTDGIGLETAKQLVKCPQVQHVVLHGRNETRLSQAKTAVEQSAIGAPQSVASVSGVIGDFTDMHSVLNMVTILSKEHPKLNTVLCNAGVLNPKRELTKDNLEATFQINHLAHFLLCNKLIPVLKQNAPSRIILVSSICHNWYPMLWDDMQSEKDYEKYTQYSRTKLMNMLFAYALVRRCKDSGITVNALEPGVIETKLLRNGGFSGAPVSKGAVSPVHCCTSDELDKVEGKYFDNSGKQVRPDKMALNEADQERLWTLSEEMCKDLGVW